jgi:hypothetical protein
VIRYINSIHTRSVYLPDKNKIAGGLHRSIYAGGLSHPIKTSIVGQNMSIQDWRSQPTRPHGRRGLPALPPF